MEGLNYEMVNMLPEKKKKREFIMISFVFPPLNYSGSERPFQFSRYLPEFGFKPLVISQDNFLNYRIEKDYDSLEKLHPESKVYRLKTYKSFIEKFKVIDWTDELIYKLIKKKKILSRIIESPGQLMYKNSEWEFQVFWKAFFLKITRNPELIFATGPEWKNLEIGYKVSKFLSLPLIVDMRDPWTYGVMWNPKDKADAELQIRKEKKILEHATRVVFTSPLTESVMLNRHPKLLANKTHSITNGFDSELTNLQKTKNVDKFVITFTGKLTKGVRNPEIFLKGLQLACQNSSFRNDVLVQFIGYIDDFKDQIASYNNHNNITIKEPVPREESINEMINSDVLLLIQTISGLGDDVISGKIYEYINTRKKILAVVPESGGDAWLLNQNENGDITGIVDEHKIKDSLLELWNQWKSNNLNTQKSINISKYNRYNLTKQLSEVMELTLNKDFKLSLQK